VRNLVCLIIINTQKTQLFFVGNIGPLNVDDEEEILPLIKKEEEYYE
jgi:hypothetical protein